MTWDHIATALYAALYLVGLAIARSAVLRRCPELDQTSPASVAFSWAVLTAGIWAIFVRRPVWASTMPALPSADGR